MPRVDSINGRDGGERKLPNCRERKGEIAARFPVLPPYEELADDRNAPRRRPPFEIWRSPPRRRHCESASGARGRPVNSLRLAARSRRALLRRGGTGAEEDLLGFRN
ncbi:hypothetical protein ACJRO7_000767 [Eucalyptus globulus]|uniref:Uncharacterized protein n=1 Tax=Eucalyptus globulus TaxID=34317 RepID=A0ABD3LNQ0_EUCGL